MNASTTSRIYYISVPPKTLNNNATVPFKITEIMSETFSRIIKHREDD